MVQSEWSPTVLTGDQPLWRRLVAALQVDVSSGRLAAGQRLPPHRNLAYTLGVSVGTISKAYMEAERAGLLVSHVGRGTFVAAAKLAQPLRSLASMPIDLARNLPPVGPALAALTRTLGEMHKRSDFGAMIDYSPTAGLATVRDAGADWLRAQCGLLRARSDSLIQTNGGQHALMLACASVASQGATILCDVATYPGNRTIAAWGGWQLYGVSADEQGMNPDALDRAVATTGARVVIVLPTLQNPTGITLDAERRLDILEVARKRDLIVIEDDVYRVFGRPDDPAPMAASAPERVIHIASLSKALSPGLRLGFVVPPENAAISERLLLGVQASIHCPPPMGGLIFSQWMEDGSALQILDEVRAETTRRVQLARDVLGGAMAQPHSPHSLHIWLPMSAERARTVAALAVKANVEVTPPGAPFVDEAAISGLRLCLGTVGDIATLGAALDTVRSALQGELATSMRGIV